MKPCECFAPDDCVYTCPNAEYDHLFWHQDYGPQYLQEMGYKRISCKQCGAHENPECHRCIFYGDSTVCPQWQEAIQEAVKEVRQ